MAKEWHEVSEAERPSYLHARARELQGAYGISLAEAKAMLCAHWGWDPKRYIVNDDVTSESSDAELKL